MLPHHSEDILCPFPPGDACLRGVIQGNGDSGNEPCAEVCGCWCSTESDRGRATTELYASRAPDLGEGKKAQDSSKGWLADNNIEARGSSGGQEYSKQLGNPPRQLVEVLDTATLVVGLDILLGTARRRVWEVCSPKMNLGPGTISKVTGMDHIASGATRRDSANWCPYQPTLLCYQVPAHCEGPVRADAVEETPVE